MEGVVMLNVGTDMGFFLGGGDNLQISESTIVCTGEHKESKGSLVIKVCFFY